MLTLTKKIVEQGKQILSANAVPVVYVNDKGEFFTVHNYAMLSVHGNKDKLAEITAQTPVPASGNDEGLYAHTSLSDLKKLAKERAIAFDNKATKASLIQELEAWDKKQAAAPAKPFEEMSLEELQNAAKEKQIEFEEDATAEQLIELLTTPAE